MVKAQGMRNMKPVESTKSDSLTANLRGSRVTLVSVQVSCTITTTLAPAAEERATLLEDTSVAT